jgi:hypothetical protein
LIDRKAKSPKTLKGLAMELRLEWGRPVKMKHAGKNSIGYNVDLAKITNRAGVYIFGRRYGSQFEALYVGKSGNLRKRVRGHLNNLKLTQHLRNASSGRRLVLAARLLAKPGQRLSKCMALAERALIRHFLSEGDDLVNMQGTRIRRHQLASSGKHPKRYFPGVIFLEKSKGR